MELNSILFLIYTKCIVRKGKLKSFAESFKTIAVITHNKREKQH